MRLQKTHKSTQFEVFTFLKKYAIVGMWEGLGDRGCRFGGWGRFYLEGNMYEKRRIHNEVFVNYKAIQVICICINYFCFTALQYQLSKYSSNGEWKGFLGVL